MCPTGDKSHVEAWKAVTEFAKAVISICSVILTALLAYYVANQSEFGESRLNYLSPTLLVIAIVCAIFAFGRAIKAVSSGASQRDGVAFANVSVVFMVAGVLSIAAIQLKKAQSLDVVLVRIERETASLPVKLTSGMVHRVEASDTDYRVTFRTDADLVVVTYAVKDGRVTQLEHVAGEGKPPEKPQLCCCEPKVIIKKRGKPKSAGGEPCGAPASTPLPS